MLVLSIFIFLILLLISYGFFIRKEEVGHKTNRTAYINIPNSRLDGVQANSIEEIYKLALTYFEFNVHKHQYSFIHCLSNDYWLIHALQTLANENCILVLYSSSHYGPLMWEKLLNDKVLQISHKTIALEHSATFFGFFKFCSNEKSVSEIISEYGHFKYQTPKVFYTSQEREDETRTLGTKITEYNVKSIVSAINAMVIKAMFPKMKILYDTKFV